MQPDIAQALAQAHIDDLHRAAARQRRSGPTARPRRRAPGAAFPEQWSTLRTAAGRITLPTFRRRPDCCPA